MILRPTSRIALAALLLAANTAVASDDRMQIAQIYNRPPGDIDEPDTPFRRTTRAGSARASIDLSANCVT